MPLTHKVRTRLGWDRLVYPEEMLHELREIASCWRNRDKVNIEWGLGAGAGSNGLVCLFSGEPGTGKTAAASAICAELGISLYRANVAGIVSKYIGDTEKNLAAILDTAESAGVAIVFDEADALFAKRTDARGSGELSHNTQVAYLLDRIERFNGLAFLTTNLDSVIDSAFRRRFHITIPFEKPGPLERERIFRMTLAKAPLAEGVDFKKLSSADLAGGSIQKVAQGAAFRAASAGTMITQQRLEESIERELHSLNRLVHGL
jgi:SpoVK/Ycf46/Vps4 family AAA+-type ATPase